MWFPFKSIYGANPISSEDESAYIANTIIRMKTDVFKNTLTNQLKKNIFLK